MGWVGILSTLCQIIEPLRDQKPIHRPIVSLSQIQLLQLLLVTTLNLPPLSTANDEFITGSITLVQVAIPSWRCDIYLLVGVLFDDLVVPLWHLVVDVFAHVARLPCVAVCLQLLTSIDD